MQRHHQTRKSLPISTHQWEQVLIARVPGIGLGLLLLLGIYVLMW